MQRAIRAIATILPTTLPAMMPAVFDDFDGFDCDEVLSPGGTYVSRATVWEKIPARSVLFQPARGPVMVAPPEELVDISTEPDSQVPHC